VFSDRAISYGLWPPRSPDLTAYGLYLGESLKVKCINKSPHSGRSQKQHPSRDSSNFRGRTPCSEGSLTMREFGQERNIFSICCSSGYLLHFLKVILTAMEPSSSVSIVSGYGLDDRAIQVRSLAEKRIFSSSLSVQTGSETHPASCTGGPFPGGKAWSGRDSDHSPPSSAEIVNE
jgi:hypothetical protein